MVYLTRTFLTVLGNTMGCLSTPYDPFLGVKIQEIVFRKKMSFFFGGGASCPAYPLPAARPMHVRYYVNISSYISGIFNIFFLGGKVSLTAITRQWLTPQPYHTPTGQAGGLASRPWVELLCISCGAKVTGWWWAWWKLVLIVGKP